MEGWQMLFKGILMFQLVYWNEKKKVQNFLSVKKTYHILLNGSKFTRATINEYIERWRCIGNPTTCICKRWKKVQKLSSYFKHWRTYFHDQPSFSSSKSKSSVFLIDLKNEVTAPAGTSSKEPMVIPSIWNNNKKENEDSC